MSLHGIIMNLPLSAGNMERSDAERLAYKVGHRDARHAAAELANEFDEELDRIRADRDLEKKWRKDAEDKLDDWVEKHLEAHLALDVAIESLRERDALLRQMAQAIERHMRESGALGGNPESDNQTESLMRASLADYRELQK